MRALVLVVGLLGCAGCAPRCRAGTVLATLEIPAGVDLSQADRLEVSIDGQPFSGAGILPGMLVSGARLEVTLKSGYLVKASHELNLVVRRGSTVVAQGLASLELAPTCSVLRAQLHPPPSLADVHVDGSGGCVRIGYRAVQPDSLPASVRLFYDLGDGKGSREMVGSPAKVATSAAGTPGVFSWDTLPVLRGVRNDQVSLKVVPELWGVAGDPAMTMVAIDNRPFLPTVPPTVTLTWPPDGLTMADFNGDGLADVATISTAAGLVSVLISRGDGTFQPPAEVGVGPVPVAILATDLDGDGRIDLVTSNSNGTLQAVSVLLGKGDGTFLRQPDATCCLYPAFMVSGDFDGDQRIDLLAGSSGAWTVLFGKKDGTFSLGPSATPGMEANSIASADFNGDGRPDLALSDANYDRVLVALGRGDGTFTSEVGFPVSGRLGAVLTADFNGDGKMDIATADGGNDLTVLLGNGDGTFSVALSVPVGNGVNSRPPAAVGDFNGDGRPDLAAGREGAQVRVLIGQGDGTFLASADVTVGPLYTIAVGDLNGDGKPDLVTSNIESPFSLSVVLNRTSAACPP
jgi:hypothetical protein